MTRFRILAGALSLLCLAFPAGAASDAGESGNWPSFRGARALGVADGHPTPRTWNVESGENVRWKTPIPGLAHASPIVWGDRVYVVTVTSELADPELRIGLYGDIGAAEDDGVQQWWLYALDKASGEAVWKRKVHESEPAVRRHTKATHANATPATDGQRIVVFLGSQGLHAFGMDGKPLWSKDFGVLDAGYYMMPPVQWGFANSPVLHDGKVAVLADVQKDGFLALLDAATGKELWRTARNDVPTWTTPTIVEVPVETESGVQTQTQIVVNGFKHIGAYDFATGEEVWKLTGGGDIPVPTPIAGHGLVFITNAHGRMAPVYAVRAGARGDISLADGASSNQYIAWSVPRGGAYMQTPVLYRDLLYVCRDNGALTVFDPVSGEEKYQQRLTDSGAGFTASAVAADGKLYYTSEEGEVYVVAAGPEYQLLATNALGGVAMATPAVSEGTIYFRTKGHLIAIGERPAAAKPAAADAIGETSGR